MSSTFIPLLLIYVAGFYLFTVLTVTRLRFLTDTGVLSHVPPLSDITSLFFVQVVIILGMCRSLAVFGYYLKQPKVIFEIIGGVLLGPSAIGKDTTFTNTIFPTSSLNYLTLVSQMGLVLYLFVVGMELDPKLIVSHARRTGGIALMGMIVPFCLGIAVSRVLFDVLQGDDPAYKDVNFTAFYVFIGTAMSITAFPVLARILKEGGLIYTKSGAMVMGAAAINDAVAWCLLILAISIANAGDLTIALYVFLCVVCMALGLFLLIAPLFRTLVERVESMNSSLMNSNLFAFTLCILFLCAWTTALLGVHPIFGAFIFGLIIPRDTHLFKECNEKIEEFVLTLFLPLYFALSGLNTDVTQINTGSQGAMIVLVVVVATAGKFIGCGGMAYLSGMSLRETSVVAVLMNTRGLVELIVLNLGVTSGILSTRTFSVMVIMCLATTFMTCPLVEYIYPARIRVRYDEKPVELSEFTKEDEGEQPPIDLTEQSRHMKIGVVVDELDHMQMIMDILACFTPHAIASTLGIVAVRLNEPTMTHNDEFIGLSEGRLVRTTIEPTIITAASMRAVGGVKPQILPLSMFCKAIGAEVTSFQVVGDPLEYPLEVKRLIAVRECQMLIMPWRASQYLETLFWGTLRLTSVPIMLIVAPLSSRLSSPLPVSPQNLDDLEDVKEDVIKVSSKLSSSYFQLVSKVSGIAASSAFKTVHAIIIGKVTDMYLFPVLLRLAENPIIQVTVFTTVDFKQQSKDTRKAFRVFSHTASKYHNLVFVGLKSASDDQCAVLEETCEDRADLLLVSFEFGGNAVESNVVMNSGSVTAVASPVVEEDLVHLRRDMGVPESLCNSPLSHPELGQLGYLHAAKGHHKLVAVLHAPLVAGARAFTCSIATGKESSTAISRFDSSASLAELDAHTVASESRPAGEDASASLTADIEIGHSEQDSFV